jgi:hypothetical protein
MWVVPNHVPDGQVQFQMPMPADRMTTFEGLVYLPSAAQPVAVGVCTVEKGDTVSKAILPTSTYVTTVCWVHRKLLRYKALGVMYSKPSVCMGKYDSASERHLTRCENRPDFYDAGEQPQRSQEAILRRERIRSRLRRDDTDG